MTTPLHLGLKRKILPMHTTALQPTRALNRDLARFDLSGEMWADCCVPPYCSGDFKRRLPRTPSTGTMSSADDLDDREPSSPFENGE